MQDTNRCLMVSITLGYPRELDPGSACIKESDIVQTRIGNMPHDV